MILPFLESKEVIMTTTPKVGDIFKCPKCGDESYEMVEPLGDDNVFTYTIVKSLKDEIRDPIAYERFLCPKCGMDLFYTKHMISHNMRVVFIKNTTKTNWELI
jgi:predicted RNA-binding Zn-ribbon protein involved in translation (DUF1610 family)